MCPPREFPLGFGTIKRSVFGAVAIYYRRSLQYSIVQKLLLGKLLPLTPAFQRSLWKYVRPVSPLSDSVPSRHLFWCCSDLLPEVSPVLDRTETTLGEVFPTYASLPEVSLEMRPPREFPFGFGTIKASFFWLCSDLLPKVSPVFDRTEVTLGEVFPPYASLPEVSLEMRPPREFSLGFGTIKASLLAL